MRQWHPLPVEVYSLIEQTPATVLLESGPAFEFPARSRLFLHPSHVLAPRDDAALDGMFEQIESALRHGHSAAGFFTYECGNAFEPVARMRPAALHRPLAWFGIYPRSYIFDHAAGTFLDGDPPGLKRLSLALGGSPLSGDMLDVRMGIEREEYVRRIATIHRLIGAGDVYQLNFTFPVHLTAGDAPALYARLRSRQSIPYGAFVHAENGHRILSFSPELFFRTEEHDGLLRITTRPMKGTARRGRTTAEDQEISQALRHDEKNRAENVMIVDLLRNDLGRLCEFGSVRVENLFAVERYDTLWQMTSTVAGDLRPGVGMRDILRSLFPSGSVTGAPKIRAMQLLAELEDDTRGVYTGAIGCFSPGKTIFNVAIRTIELDGDTGKMGIGSGIVIDSVPEEEFLECQLKAKFLTEPQVSFELVETMRWQGSCPLLELHLDRLKDSADYFGFQCDRANIRQQLLVFAGGFEDLLPRRVRLLVNAGGDVRFEAADLPEHGGDRMENPLRVGIASERTDPADRFLFHKTTHRPLYAHELEAAQQVGCDDVLFLNGDGQVTESALGNLFMERGGRWFTPPVECGLLAGVYRRHLLETRPEIEQQVMTLSDLKEAAALYLSNAVRGIRRITLEQD